MNYFKCDIRNALSRKSMHLYFTCQEEYIFILPYNWVQTGLHISLHILHKRASVNRWKTALGLANERSFRTESLPIGLWISLKLELELFLLREHLSHYREHLRHDGHQRRSLILRVKVFDALHIRNIVFPIFKLALS